MAWVLYPETSSKQAKIKREAVVITGELTVILPKLANSRTAKMVPTLQVFDTRDEALAASATGGKVFWTHTNYQLDFYDMPDKEEKVEVFQVLATGMIGHYDKAAVRLDDKGNPTKTVLMLSNRDLYPTQKAAARALAEKMSDWYTRIEKKINIVRAVESMLEETEGELEDIGVSVPSAKLVERRKRDRYRRNEAKRKAQATRKRH